MSDLPTSWLSSISASPAYLYRDFFYCEKCALDTGKTTDPLLSYSAQQNNPIGPIKNFFSDHPIHCSSDNFCLNPIQLPSGTLVGRPIETTLSPAGLTTSVHFIASHILYGSRNQKQIGRLWLKLCTNAFGPPPLLRLSPTIPKRISSHPKVKKLTKLGAVLNPLIFTDLSSLYGTAVNSQSTILWRMPVSDVGTLDDLLTVALPLSESTERSAKDLLEEAVECSAWE